MAIYWPTPGFKGRTFKLCVLTRWDFNFCVRSPQLREVVNEVELSKVDNEVEPSKADNEVELSRADNKVKPS